jgi:hypothetical protein
VLFYIVTTRSQEKAMNTDDNVCILLRRYNQQEKFSSTEQGALNQQISKKQETKN